MTTAVLSIAALGLGLGLLLGVAARFLRVEANPIENEILALLPGSQCGQCGYAGCGPAAAALASGQAAATLCPPGGRALAEEIAGKTGASLDLAGMADQVPMIAHVTEGACVGCTKCFKRCPTDAILGAPKMMHAVFADACTGCGKCAEACPAECIEMRPVTPSLATWFWPKPALAA
jgi:electron transport complex protein RnfB